MPFQRPSLNEINNRVESMARGLFGVTLLLRRSFLSVISKVISGPSHVLHGHLDYNSKQILPTTMDLENLTAFSGLFGIIRFSATKGKYKITLRITDDTIPIVVPNETIFLDSKQNRYVFSLTAFEKSVGSSGRVALIQAELPGISEGTLAVGDMLTTETTIANLDLTRLEVTSIEVIARDQETIEEFRTRTIARLQTPTRAGIPEDYIFWGKQFHQLVKRVYVFPRSPSAGSVTIILIGSGGLNLNLGLRNLFRDDFLPSLVPLTATVNVSEAVTQPVVMFIQLSTTNADIRQSIQSSVGSFFENNANYGGAYNPDTGLEFTDEVFKSKLDESISLAASGHYHKITQMTINNVVVIRTNQNIELPIRTQGVNNRGLLKGGNIGWTSF